MEALMRLWQRKKRNSAKTGCGFVLVQGLIIAGLLLVNGFVVRAFILANQSVDDVRISQTIQFLVPLLMIFAELWIYDFLAAKTTDDQS